MRDDQRNYNQGNFTFLVPHILYNYKILTLYRGSPKYLHIVTRKYSQY